MILKSISLLEILLVVKSVIMLRQGISHLKKIFLIFYILLKRNKIFIINLLNSIRKNLDKLKLDAFYYKKKCILLIYL
jgi:hypothetical protein